MKTEENNLILKAQGGDSEAENDLLKAYSPLVKRIARSYYAIGADGDDLIQSGMIGLMNAVRKFDVQNGTASFKTYASTCIHNMIKTVLRKQNTITKNNTPLSEIIDLPSDINLERGYEEKETERLLTDAISSVLNEREMNVLKLYPSAMSYQEISDKLGIEKKKVDNTIYSFRKKIKKLINRDELF